MSEWANAQQAQDVNRAIWDAIYGTGSVLLYPSEMFVRLFFRYAGKALAPGMTMLDHGAGSGNNTEFLIRRGLRVVATDISQEALKSIQQRFRYANLPFPETKRIDSIRPLSEQLPVCDAAISWDCLYYNTAERVRQDIADIISRIEPGGLFFFNMLTPEHHFITEAVEIAPGTYRYTGGISQKQAGSVLCAPDSLKQLHGWCEGADILTSGEFTYTEENRHSAYWYLVCRRR